MAKKKAITKKSGKRSSTKKKSATKSPKAAAKKASASAKKTAAKRSTPKASAVKGKSVAWYISTLEDWQADIVKELDSLIVSAAPKSNSSIKWAQPVYECDGPFCFIKAAKKHVTFGFWRGVELDDEKGLLEGSGDKMRHVKLTATGDIQKTVLKRMVKQAVTLNRKLGDPSR